MIVSQIMTANPFTVQPDTPVTDAQEIMRREKISRLPVLDHHKLVGIVSEKDLLYASPSPASSLDVYEMTNLLSKLKVKAVMSKTPQTIHANDLVEDAARLMRDADVGGLPVLDENDNLCGIVTESDVFRLFVDLFGVRTKGIRATLRIPEKPGEIAELSQVIGDAGGDIISFGTFPGNAFNNAVCIIKVSGISMEAFIKAVEKSIIEVLDIREA
ncbi:MAG: CBS domain-containing protein [Spirochaetaceae bacterium]|nr:MAG: CBS domain-containing protein [Spirochaetaceae bacterium]